jgi:hypothetical protein
MAATLKKIAVGNILSTRTLVMTATAGVQTILIGGNISNTDVTGAYHGVTVEVQQVDSSYINIVTLAPIAVGGSLQVPKLVLAPGEKLYMTADAPTFLQAYISYVEKT